MLASLVVAFLAGTFICALVMLSRIRRLRDALGKAEVEAATLNERCSRKDEELNQLRDLDAAWTGKEEAWIKERASAAEEYGQLKERSNRIPELEATITTQTGTIEGLLGEKESLNVELTRVSAILNEKLEQAAQQAPMLQAARDEFKLLTAEATKQLTSHNHADIGQVLSPLREQIKEFKGKVEEVYHNDTVDRTKLSAQIENLVSVTNNVSGVASDLAQAFKASSNKQGRLGELILENILAASGLREGHDYALQKSERGEDGSRARPDAIVYLPEQRHLIIDAKLSLIAYHEYLKAVDEDGRREAMKAHLKSVRTHINELSKRNYPQLCGLDSLDFAVMFMPFESAFILALEEDDKLLMEGWDKNVLMVGPSALLFVVRTVANLWQQEQRSRKVQDIGKRGAQLYDKFVGFIADIEKIGERLEMAKSSYNEAHKKLTSGEGNLVRQATLLKELGVNPSKIIAPRLLEAALDDTLEFPEAGFAIAAAAD